MSVFQFKKFSIEQQKSAMKVGTDGVLLGSWASCEQKDFVLDIGSGTGLISLMIAQRNLDINIVGIDIDTLSCQEAKFNISNSNWSDRIKICNISLQRFKSEKKFDLIVSNPPFFPLNKLDQSRDNARHRNKLSFEELIKHTSILLSQYGVFSTIIPIDFEEYFFQIAKKYNLFCNRACYIKGNKMAKIKRLMLEFSFTNTQIKKEYLTIEKSRHTYTDRYIALCKDFYLGM